MCPPDCSVCHNAISYLAQGKKNSGISFGRDAFAFSTIFLLTASHWRAVGKRTVVLRAIASQASFAFETALARPTECLELTRLGRRCWGERKKEVLNAKNPSTIRAGVSAANHRLVRSGYPIAQLAHEFEASANASRKWVKQSGLDDA
jgi:hypothetical protein